MAHTTVAPTVDALSWAWEHWDQLQTMENPVGYLYRVGQSATRRYAMKPVPFDRPDDHDEPSGLSPELAAAIGRLPAQQRTC